ncbi:TM2 domain-containing protein [Streptomyces sp. CWNU-52B]|uniref:TM2 domain-containing protein n=1 Tax=unclassified Streptomyces TaxID=2593676 RepID=UPI0039C0A3EB
MTEQPQQPQQPPNQPPGYGYPNSGATPPGYGYPNPGATPPPAGGTPPPAGANPYATGQPNSGPYQQPGPGQPGQPGSGPQYGYPQSGAYPPPGTGGYPPPGAGGYPPPGAFPPGGAYTGDPDAPYGYDAYGRPYSDKSKVVAGVLQIVLGSLGIGRFYMGSVGIGIAQLFTCGGFGIWSLIDGILLLTGNDATDSRGRPLRG